eukprot:12861978-Alexandrium_andersonii.AAC.1
MVLALVSTQVWGGVCSAWVCCVRSSLQHALQRDARPRLPPREWCACVGPGPGLPVRPVDRSS